MTIAMKGFSTLTCWSLPNQYAEHHPSQEPLCRTSLGVGRHVVTSLSTVSVQRTSSAGWCVCAMNEARVA